MPPSGRSKPGVGNICVTLREFVFFLLFNFITFLELLFGKLEIAYLKQSIYVIMSDFEISTVEFRCSSISWDL